MVIILFHAELHKSACPIYFFKNLVFRRLAFCIFYLFSNQLDIIFIEPLINDCSWTRTQNHLVHKRTLNHLANWPNDWAVFWVLICTVHLTVCSCHVTYAFQSESTLCSYLNVKEVLARSRRAIRSLSDCNWTQTKNHLVQKRTLNHLPKLVKWLSCVLSAYLYRAFDCMFLLIHTL